MDHEARPLPLRAVRDDDTETAPDDGTATGLVEATIGAAATATWAAASLAKGAARLAGPLAHAALHPPLIPESLHPARAVETLAERGREAVTATSGDVERLVAAVVPAVVGEVLDTLDLTALIQERVDIDGIVATVDVSDVVSRVDVNAIVARVDIDAIIDRVNIDAIAARIDLDAIVDRIDVDAIAARIDLESIVDRLNVLGIAEEVINELDLPEIIRDSTGSMASQVVRDARMQSIGADETLARVVDKLLRRRRSRATLGPGQSELPAESPVEAAVPEDRP